MAQQAYMESDKDAPGAKYNQPFGLFTKTDSQLKDEASETWDAYIERFECFLQANDYTDFSNDRKRAHFLNACGPQIFATARALVAPLSVSTVPWPTLLAKLKGHYAPAPSRIARRFLFRQRLQKEGESLNTYLAALREEAINCEFENLDDSLLEQLVCGVHDLRLQRRLLAKTDITLQSAVDEARAFEMSDRSAAEMRRLPTALPATRCAAIHIGDACPDNLSDDEDEVNRLKAAGGNKRPPNKRLTSAPCLGCGEEHPRVFCRFKNAVCQRCGKRGHLAKVCRSVPQDATTSAPANGRLGRKGFPPSKDYCFAISRDRTIPSVSVSHASSGQHKKIFLTVQVEGRPCRMEVDTGSSKSILAWQTLKKLVPTISPEQLQPCNTRLHDYQGNSIPILGCGNFLVEKGDFSGSLPVLVVKGSLPSLLGLDWFEAWGLTVSGVHTTVADGFEALTSEFAEVFDGSLGNYKGTPISLNLDPQVAPIRLKPRRVPFALRPKVDAELDKLLAQGILEPTDYSKWETPIVIPTKQDGSIRICGDFKCTLNRALQAHPYPVPVVQHLLHSLGHGTIFAKLDMTQAYQQLPVDDATATAQTIVTHRGAFKCRRLQFGVCVAPGIFQSLMERLLQGIPGVIPYFDDVLISANNKLDLLERTRQVLIRFQQNGLKLKKAKCKFGVPQVEFLGFLVDGSGIHPTPSKVEAIKKAPTPTCKAELQAFLGLLNFYSIFLPHKASVAEPLHRLLDSKAPWVWEQPHATAFTAVKNLLTSNAVLIQYNDNLPLTLVCDASPYGIGAVLSHVLPNGTEAPVAYYSRTLSSAERNYGQLDKEALALVAAVKRFHDYVYGRFFQLVTDHKPLLGLLAGDKQTPQIMSPRMTRWSVFLAAYNYQLVYRPGAHLGNADGLSRCPLTIAVDDPAPDRSVLLIDDFPDLVTASDVAKLSAKDPTLVQVLDWVRRGWPLGPVPGEFQPFTTRQHELSISRGCLLWGSRVVIPPTLRRPVLQRLHESHPGTDRMKALGRSYVWWPKMDQAISEWVAKCQRCQQSRPVPPAATPREWETPRSPWSRLHIDLAGPFMGQNLLIVVDAYSKWVEIARMASTTSDAVIKVLRNLFATHGLPDVVVSDNGPQFTSATFQLFLAGLGIRHALVAPYHPSSNGRAERAVRSAKDALARFGPGDWQEKGRNISWRNTLPLAR
ncbi:uncharacterized protein K02A2.6-like [Pantherophis guttatus]|uniref:Gypsy retrotransposon integrase-like protein 1 n=1 Tax=Pantherophis guttatus TaxID=94885 RepID=A0ABM3ZA37_PANGU|nr:uncharacterized protein K02A2.6-like [Pantherophis guttatus]